MVAINCEAAHHTQLDWAEIALKTDLFGYSYLGNYLSFSNARFIL